MKSMSQVLDIKEVVMDASFFDECALGVGNKVVHERPKPTVKNLGDNLCNGVNKAYRPIVNDLLRALFLGQKNHVSGVQTMEVDGMEVAKASKTSTLIVAQHRLKKAPVKPSGPGALSIGIL